MTTLPWASISPVSSCSTAASARTIIDPSQTDCPWWPTGRQTGVLISTSPIKSTVEGYLTPCEILSALAVTAREAVIIGTIRCFRSSGDFCCPTVKTHVRARAASKEAMRCMVLYPQGLTRRPSNRFRESIRETNAAFMKHPAKPGAAQRGACGILSCTLEWMLTDLVQIRTLGERKRTENERFRRFLKSHDHSDRRLRRIAEDIEGQIDCSQCANCCRVATVRISDRDIERLAHQMRISRQEFLRQYTTESEEEGRILLRSDTQGCVFLDGKTCTVYEARPDTCRRFPHLVRGSGSIASRMWQFIDRACYCPIVYNSLEAFKADLKFSR